MPGATETEFFRRAEMRDTAVGTAEKGRIPPTSPTTVSNAMIKGEGDVVSGFKNKVQSAADQRNAGRSFGKPASQDGRTPAPRRNDLYFASLGLR